ncbi:MAG TPA: M23 family metallopeptidase [Chloroflexota bacterium]|nr:M23 family metallopeptidase [Chloroflexota bacterium]
MLRNEEWRRIGAVNVQGLVARAKPTRQLARLVPEGLLCLLLIAGAVVAHETDRPHKAAVAHVLTALDLLPPPDDVAPSTMRQQVLDRLAAGLPLPDPGLVELQEENQVQAVALEQQLQLSSKYFQEIQSRDADISKLNQQLADVASQLGLPKSRLAPPVPPAQRGVGALLPDDQSALTPTNIAPLPVNNAVTSLQDLVAAVKQYLALPCPLPVGDPRCAQAVDHAKAELARGHGLDMSKPDASPTLNVDVAQPFGPTDLVLEPMENVNGEMVHFHDGLDLAANYDEPVMAAASGTVVFAGVIPSGALTVEIAHAGGIHTWYLHEEQLLVQEGQQVQKGQIIGLVGATGLATGPHVHFQVEDPTGKPIDPLPFLT